MISGIFIATMMLAFAGLVRWAWSSRQHEAFVRAAATPLHDEERQS